MGRCSKKRSGFRKPCSRTVGLWLMLAGVLVLIIFLPKWLWASVLGVILISAGFLMWRFN